MISTTCQVPARFVAGDGERSTGPVVERPVSTHPYSAAHTHDTTRAADLIMDTFFSLNLRVKCSCPLEMRKMPEVGVEPT